MSKTITVEWQNERAFIASNADDSRVPIGHGGNAMSASELVLAALGGCMSTTVIGVLEKKRQNVTGLEVEVTGEQLEDWPKTYTSYHMIYKVTGIDVDLKAVERAIELAETRYCTVSSSLAGPITHTIELIPAEQAVPA